MITLTLPEGRIVQGNPQVARQKTDTLTKAPVVKEGKPVMETFFAIAIPKNGTTHWNQTDWGKQIYDEGVREFPKGEYQIGSFAWKITDGDSTVPNKKMKKPCDREGFPGHWVISMSSQLNITCYDLQNGQAVLAAPATIKTGHYARAQVSIKGNGRTDSPGVYVNPLQVLRTKEGPEIVSSELDDTATAFGVPQADPTGGAFASPAPAPAPEYMAPPPPQPQGERTYAVNGGNYTAAQLRGFGWTDAQIATLP